MSTARCRCEHWGWPKTRWARSQCPRPLSLTPHCTHRIAPTALNPPIAPIALRRNRPLGAPCLESANNELNQRRFRGSHMRPAPERLRTSSSADAVWRTRRDCHCRGLPLSGTDTVGERRRTVWGSGPPRAGGGCRSGASTARGRLNIYRLTNLSGYVL